jgi:hypothetical protein
MPLYEVVKLGAALVWNINNKKGKKFPRLNM